MSLNPSNMVAENVNGGVKVFRNLAGRIKQWDQKQEKDVLIPNAAEIVAATTEQVIGELAEAGMGMKIGEGSIGYFDLHSSSPEYIKSEVPTGVVGFAYHWKFERAWYYYRAEGAGIPLAVAAEFDKEWGRQCRVNGDCACRGAEFWGDGFAISSYHIDTQSGLNAFVAMLKTVYKPHPRE